MKKIFTIFLLAFVFTLGLLSLNLTSAKADGPAVTSESISYGDMIIRTARAGGEAYTGLTLVDTNVKHGNVANNVINKFTTFTAPSDSWSATLGTEGDNAYAYNYKLFTLADDGVIAEVVAKHNVKVTVSASSVAGWTDPAVLSVYKLSGGNLETIKSVQMASSASESVETLGCEVQLNAGDTMYYEFRFPWTGSHRNLENLPTFNFEYVEGEVVTPDTPATLNESVKYSDVILKTAENAGEMAAGDLISYGLFYGAVSTSGAQLNKFTTFTVDGNGGATLGITSDPVYCPNAGQVYYKGLDTGAVLKITALCDVTLDASRDPAYGLGWVANSTLSAYVESNGTFTQILNVDCTDATTAAEFALNDIVLSKGDSLYYVLTFQWDYRNTQNLGQFTFDVEHTHNHSTELSYDAENHWNECSCKDKKNVADHVWDEGVVTTKPTGTEPGVRTFACECGQTRTEEIPATGPTDAAVKALFAKYYDNIGYTKETVLNINKLTAEEVKLYFHNSQDVRYRRTEYTKNGLSMTTSTDGITYDNVSTYTNGTNCVNHTGFGGSWTVKEYTSVEEWFVTLKDFADSSIAGWTVDGNVYTFELVPTTAVFEDEMTRMAREFVAPMWLAPNASNWCYVTFTKLTVEEIESTLVMKLYVSEGNEGQLLEGSNLVFAEATITFDDGSRTIAEALAIGGKQAHNTYTTDKYTLTGTVTNVYNTQYGNFYLKDNNGNQICIYGLYSADGKTRYDAMSYKPVEGDIVTVTGVLGTYNSTIQMKNGWLLEVTPHEHDYTEATCTTPATCTICKGTNGETLEHPDDDKNHACDVCKVHVGTHEDITGDSLCDYCGEEISGGSEEPVVGLLATFDFGANGSASHVDGNSLGSSKTYTVGTYKLALTSMANIYGPAYDAKGNSCIKLGASSKAGKLTFTVPENVTEVVIYVAKYKANTTKVKINGTQYTISGASNNGAYDEIKIDTTTNKTLTVETVSGGYRAMINTIVYNGYAQ